MRALGSAQSLDKADRVKVPEDASPEDLDKPLNQESYEMMDTKFLTSHRFQFPAVFKPSPLTDARSYRELTRRSFSVRQLSRVGNLFQFSLRPSDIIQETELGGGFSLTKNKKASYEEPVTTMLDALVRIHLLLLSFVRVSFLKTWTNGLNKTETWFTLDDMQIHYSYLWQRATEGNLSVGNFLAREAQLRVIALGHQMGSEKLSLAKALAKARKECGDLWGGFSATLVAGMSPIGTNPMKRALEDQQSGPNKAGKTSGVQRASNASEITSDGKPAPLRKGNKASQGRVTLPDGSSGTLCGAFRDGRGCTRWPCGGVHACDLLIKSKNFQPCLGEHSRANCPHNKQ